MNAILSNAGRLALLCGVAGLILAVAYIGLAPAIAAGVDAELSGAVDSVAGGARAGAAVPVAGRDHIARYYPLETGPGAVAGYVVLLRGQGYAGEITLIASYTPSGEIQRARFLDRQSGPPTAPRNRARGLLSAFVGSGAAGAGSAQVVSGASVSFFAVREMLAAGSDFVRSLGANK